MINNFNNFPLFQGVNTLQSIYDFNGLTTQEILCQFFEKIQEIINQFNEIDNKFTDLDVNTKEKLEYLLGEGLSTEVGNKLLDMYNKGQLADVINNTIFSNINKDLQSRKCYVNILTQLPENFTPEDVRYWLQKTVDTLSTMGGGTVIIPPGTYKVARSSPTSEYCILWKSNVSMKGSGIGKTIFKIGNREDTDLYTFIYRLTKANPITNCDFSDFTVDMSEMANETTPYSHKGKAFYIQGQIGGTYERLELISTPSTALGIDFIKDVKIDKVICKNCGRLWHLDYTSSTGTHLEEGPGGAGIGIGTGYLDDESCIVSNCICDGCGHYGIFFEHQALFGVSTYTKVAKNVIIHNNIIKNGRFHGIGIRGGNTYNINNNLIYDNEGDGINLNSGEKASNLETLTVKNININNNICNTNRDGISIDGSCKIFSCDIKENHCSFNRMNGISVSYRNKGNATKSRIIIKNNSIEKNVNAIYYSPVGGNESVYIYDNDYIDNECNCGRSQLKKYGCYTVDNLIFDELTTNLTIKIKPKVTNKISIISNKDNTYTGSNLAKGFTLGMTSESKLYLSIVEKNGGAETIYLSSDVINCDNPFFLRITKSNNLYKISVSYDATVYNDINFDTDFSDNLLKCLKSLPNTNTDLFREWCGNFGYSKYAEFTYFYKLYSVNTINENYTFEITSNCDRTIVSNKDSSVKMKAIRMINLLLDDNKVIEE